MDKVTEGAFDICAVLYILAALISLCVSFYSWWYRRRRRFIEEAMKREEEERALSDSTSRTARAPETEAASENNDEGNMKNKEDDSVKRISGKISAFPKQLAIAFLLRAAWFLLKRYNVWAYDPNNHHGNNTRCYQKHTAVTAFNRVSKLFLFSAFSNISFLWSEVYTRHLQVKEQRLRNLSSLQVQSRAQKSRCCSPTAAQYLLSFWVYAILIALLAAEYFWCDDAISVQIYNFESFAISFFFLVLSILFLWNGCKVYQVVRSIKQDPSVKRPVTVRVARRTLLVIIVCVISFLIGSTCALYRPITGLDFSTKVYHIIYPWFIYPFPDLIPSMFVLWLFAPKEKLPSPRSSSKKKTPATPLLEISHSEGTNKLASYSGKGLWV